MFVSVLSVTMNPATDISTNTPTDNISTPTTTVSNVSVSDNTSSTSESNIQEMQKYDMGYEHGYLDGYDGDAYDSFSGDFGKGYSVGYDNGVNDYGYGLRPEWQVDNLVYKRWSPSDKAKVDITTGKQVN